MSKLIFDIANFFKHAFSTFFLSLFRPRRFFLTTRYDHLKADPNLYLFFGLICYLLWYSASVYFYIAPKKIIEILNNFVEPSNIIQAVIFTVPLFIFCTFLLQLASKRIKKSTSIDFTYFGQVMFTNALIIESIMYLLYFFLYRINQHTHSVWFSDMLAVYYKIIYTTVDIFGAERYFSEPLIFAILGIVYVLLLTRHRGFKNVNTLLLVLLCIFASNIVNFFYAWEYRIFDPENSPRSISKKYEDEAKASLSVTHLPDIQDSLMGADLHRLYLYYQLAGDSLYTHCSMLLTNPFSTNLYVDPADFITFSGFDPGKETEAALRYRRIIESGFSKQKNNGEWVVVKGRSTYLLQSSAAINCADFKKEPAFHTLLDNGIFTTARYSFFDSAGFRNSLNLRAKIIFRPSD